MLLRLSRGPALLALALPLAVALAFSDETLDKVPKSEGYCSRIRLRVQGTRREGYTEFSLRVEGDPDFYKPGTSYRGKWPAVVLGARDLAPGGRQPAQCRRRRFPGARCQRSSAERPFCPGCPILSAPTSVRRRRGGRSRRCSPQESSGSQVWVRLSDASLWPGFYCGWFQGAVETRLSPDPFLGSRGPWLTSRVLGRVVTPVFPPILKEGNQLFRDRPPVGRSFQLPGPDPYKRRDLGFSPNWS